jgi:hypothetical protein
VTRENEIDLIISKIETSPRKKRHEILSFLLDNHSDRFDDLITVLNHKKLYHRKKFWQGDVIKIPVNISVYPSLNRSYYEEKGLIDEDGNIKVRVKRINPITEEIYFDAVSSNLTIESEIKIGNYYIPEQEDLFEL